MGKKSRKGTPKHSIDLSKQHKKDSTLEQAADAVEDAIEHIADDAKKFFHEFHHHHHESTSSVLSTDSLASTDASRSWGASESVNSHATEKVDAARELDVKSPIEAANGSATPSTIIEATEKISIPSEAETIVTIEKTVAEAGDAADAVEPASEAVAEDTPSAEVQADQTAITTDAAAQSEPVAEDNPAVIEVALASEIREDAGAQDPFSDEAHVESTQQPATTEEVADKAQETSAEAREEMAEVIEATQAVTEPATSALAEEDATSFEENAALLQEADEVAEETAESIVTPEETVLEELVVVEETPAIVEETSAIIEETPATAGETSVIVEDTPVIVEESPAIAEDTPAIVEETSAIVEETPATAGETPVIVEDTPVIVETTAAIAEDTPAIVEDTPAIVEETAAVEVVVTESEDADALEVSAVTEEKIERIEPISEQQKSVPASEDIVIVEDVPAIKPPAGFPATAKETTVVEETSVIEAAQDTPAALAEKSEAEIAEQAVFAEQAAPAEEIQSTASDAVEIVAEVVSVKEAITLIPEAVDVIEETSAGVDLTEVVEESAPAEAPVIDDEKLEVTHVAEETLAEPAFVQETVETTEEAAPAEQLAVAVEEVAPAGELVAEEKIEAAEETVLASEVATVAEEPSGVEEPLVTGTIEVTEEAAPVEVVSVPVEEPAANAEDVTVVEKTEIIEEAACVEETLATVDDSAVEKVEVVEEFAPAEEAPASAEESATIEVPAVETAEVVEEVVPTEETPATVEVPAAVEEVAVVEVATAVEASVAAEESTATSEKAETVEEATPVDEAVDAAEEAIAVEKTEAVVGVTPEETPVVLEEIMTTEEVSASVIEEPTKIEESALVAEEAPAGASKPWFDRLADEVTHVKDDVIEWVEGTSGVPAGDASQPAEGAVAAVEQATTTVEAPVAAEETVMLTEVTTAAEEAAAAIEETATPSEKVTAIVEEAVAPTEEVSPPVESVVAAIETVVTSAEEPATPVEVAIRVEEVAVPDNAATPTEEVSIPVESVIAAIESVVASAEEPTASVETATSVEEVAAPVEEVVVSSEEISAPVESVNAALEAASASAAPVEVATLIEEVIVPVQNEESVTVEEAASVKEAAPDAALIVAGAVIAEADEASPANETAPVEQSVVAEESLAEPAAVVEAAVPTEQVSSAQEVTVVEDVAPTVEAVIVNEVTPVENISPAAETAQTLSVPAEITASGEETVELAKDDAPAATEAFSLITELTTAVVAVGAIVAEMSSELVERTATTEEISAPNKVSPNDTAKVEALDGSEHAEQVTSMESTPATVKETPGAVEVATVTQDTPTQEQVILTSSEVPAVETMAETVLADPVEASALETATETLAEDVQLQTPGADISTAETVMERMPSSVTARALHPTEDFPPAQEQVVSSITSRASGPQHSFRAYSDDIKEDEVQAVVSEVVAAQPLEEVAVTVVISDINTSQGENDETISHAIEPAAGITPETPEASLPMPEVPTERPKSPWTPSYSVTVQGPGAEAEADVEELEQLPPTTVQVHAVDIVTEVMTTADVPVIRTDDEDEALIVSQADTSDAAPSSVADAENAIERPNSPWVPSYSVKSQGASPGHSPRVEAVEIQATENDTTFTTHEASEPLTTTISTAVEVAITKDEDTCTEQTEILSQAIAEDPVHPPISTELADDMKGPTEDIPSLAAAIALANSIVLAPSMTPDVEAPKSPSWVPSYSVSSQGASPLQVPEATHDADVEVVEPLPVPASAAEESATHAEATTEMIEGVSTGSGTMASEQSQAEVTTTDVHISTSNNLIQDAVEVPELDTAITVDSTVGVERSRSPWTPSYSVTLQGSSPFRAPVTSEQDLDELEALPSLSASAAFVESTPTQGDVPEVVQEVVEIVVEETPSNEAASDSILQAETTGNKTDLTVQDVIDERPPSRPWTPSYSVTRQGPGSPGVEVLQGEEDISEAMVNGHFDTLADGEALNSHSSMYMFPSTEDSAVEASRDASKPVLSRLVAVSGNEHIVTDPSLQQSSLLFEPRARLESTTSSRFFPGGWFSSAPKSSDGGRTSLDHAAGEFSKSPASPTVSPAVEASVSSPTNSAAEQERKKWCTIM